MSDLSESERGQLADYIAGEGSPGERALVEQWLADHPQHRPLAEALLASRRAGQHAIQTPSGAERAEFADRLTATAARVAREIQLGDGAASTRRAVVHHPAWRRHWATLGGGVALAAAATLMFWHARSPLPAADPQTEQRTGTGMRATVELADGTRVILAPRSTIRYSRSFGERDRNIHLQGEAYFVVAHRPDKPFVVYTEHAATQVLGTSFDVRAYAGDSVTQLVVTDGQVAFRAPQAMPGTGVRLVRGDRGHLDRAGLATVTHDADLRVATAWTHDQLVFQLTPLRDVIRELERWHDLQIVLSDPSLGDVPVSIAFDSASRTSAVALLAGALNVHAHQTGRVVTFDAAQH